MKRISKILIILILLLTLTSCKKIKSYNDSNGDKFIDEYYEYLADNKQGYVAIDLRKLEPDYANGHLNGFKSYQYQLTKNENEQEEKYIERISNTFLKWIELNYSKDLTIFLIDYDGSIVEKEIVNLEKIGYKKIYIYIDGYDTLINHLNNKVEIKKGVEDCGC